MSSSVAAARAIDGQVLHPIIHAFLRILAHIIRIKLIAERSEFRAQTSNSNKQIPSRMARLGGSGATVLKFSFRHQSNRCAAAPSYRVL